MKDSLGMELVGSEVRYLLISGGRVTRAEILSGLELDEAIRHVKENTGAEKALVTIASPEFHTRKLPVRPDEDTLKFFMKFQVGNDYQWLAKDEYIAFAPTYIIHSHYAMLQRAGIEPGCVEISGLSAVRTFMENYYERQDDNIVVVYFSDVANYLMFLKEGETVLGVSRHPGENPNLIAMVIQYLGNLVFQSMEFEVFAGGDIDRAHELIDTLRSSISIKGDLIDPFRKIKALSMESEQATKFIGALGVALRKK